MMNFKVHFFGKKTPACTGEIICTGVSVHEKSFEDAHAFPDSSGAVAGEPQVAMTADDMAHGVVPGGPVDPLPLACGQRFESEAGKAA